METIHLHITITSENFNREYTKTFKGKKSNEESIKYLKRLHSIQLEKSSLKAKLGPFKASFLSLDKSRYYSYKNDRIVRKLTDNNDYKINVSIKTIEELKQSSMF